MEELKSLCNLATHRELRKFSVENGLAGTLSKAQQIEVIVAGLETEVLDINLFYDFIEPFNEAAEKKIAEKEAAAQKAEETRLKILEAEAAKAQIELEKERLANLDSVHSKEVEAMKVKAATEQQKIEAEAAADALRIRARAEAQHAPPDQNRSKARNVSKLMPKWEGKPDQDISEFLRQFEIVAKQTCLPEQDWTLELAPLLGSVYTQICAKLSDEDCLKYEIVKLEVLKQFKLTPEAARIKFRAFSKDQDSTFSQFAFKLRTHLAQWLSLAGAKGDLDKVLEVFLLEQFHANCPNQLRFWLQDKSDATTIEKSAEYADEFIARRTASRAESDIKTAPFGLAKGSRETPKPAGNGNNQKKNGNGHPTSNQGQSSNPEIKQEEPSIVASNNGKVRRCFECNSEEHVKKDCPLLVTKPKQVNACFVANREQNGSLKQNIFKCQMGKRPVSCLRDSGSNIDLVSVKLAKNWPRLKQPVYCQTALCTEPVKLDQVRLILQTPAGVIRTVAGVSPGITGRDFQVIIGVNTLGRIDALSQTPSSEPNGSNSVSPPKTSLGVKRRNRHKQKPAGFEEEKVTLPSPLSLNSPVKIETAKQTKVKKPVQSSHKPVLKVKEAIPAAADGLRSGVQGQANVGSCTNPVSCFSSPPKGFEDSPGVPAKLNVDLVQNKVASFDFQVFPEFKDVDLPVWGIEPFQQKPYWKELLSNDC